VLHCDDESDCSAFAEPDGFPGVCLLSYRSDPVLGTPEFVDSANCYPHEYLNVHWGERMRALCNERSGCLNETEICNSSGPQSALPNYSWCEVQGIPPGRMASVRCGDSGLLCPPSGNVCCLTVDANAGTTSGACRPANECPPESIVLQCDDGSDCADKASEGDPGMCVLVYQSAQGTLFTPTRISTSECMSYAEFKLQYSSGIALCDRSARCADRWSCEDTAGSPNLLPRYHWCIARQENAPQ
jgi:hypothetical protein